MKSAPLPRHRPAGPRLRTVATLIASLAGVDGLTIAHAASEAPTLPAPTGTRLPLLVAQAATKAFQKFGPAPGRLQSNELAFTVVDLRDPTHPAQASYRGDAEIYPASVIKLFYLAALHRWLEDRRLPDTDELRRAARDMIVDSSNDATHYIVDLLTDTTSGPELPAAELTAWFEKRNAVNRYFAGLGYAHVVANKKPWCEGPYGRESQSIRTQNPSRNLLSTDDTARLLTEIVSRRCVSPTRSAAMLDLLKRDPRKPLDQGGEPSQDNAFTALALRDNPDARLWSKAGWTSQVRHDAAFVELPDGARFIVVTFTEGHANERGVIATVAREILQGLSQRD